MQKITITSSKGIIELSDSNESTIDGEYAPLVLANFDPNSNAVTQDVISCVDMHGQHLISSRLQPKNIIFDLFFTGEYRAENLTKGGGVKKMYEYRREILTHMPFNEVLTVDYTNDIRTCTINARLSEIPVFNALGSTCSARVILVADYPFWYRNGLGQQRTILSGTPVTVSVLTEGDIESPIIGTITCVSKITGITEGEFFGISQVEGNNARMSFIKNLEAGQTIVFNTGLNNEVWVKLIEPDGTERLANHYVSYRNSDLLVNNIGETKWRFTVGGADGEFTVQMQYKNLYLGV